jgi:hypothetical protein
MVATASPTASTEKVLAFASLSMIPAFLLQPLFERRIVVASPGWSKA